jgi:hypothetical protein
VLVNNIAAWHFATVPPWDIDVGHSHRMCSQCGKVKEKMEACSGCRRAWRCDECQTQHWPTHRLLCDRCHYCGTVLTKVLPHRVQQGALERAQGGLHNTDTRLHRGSNVPRPSRSLEASEELS